MFMYGGNEKIVQFKNGIGWWQIKCNGVSAFDPKTPC